MRIQTVKIYLIKFNAFSEDFGINLTRLLNIFPKLYDKAYLRVLFFVNILIRPATFLFLYTTSIHIIFIDGLLVNFL